VPVYAVKVEDGDVYVALGAAPTATNDQEICNGHP